LTTSITLKQLSGPSVTLPERSGAEWLLGRAPDCDVLLPAAGVSRQHARIQLQHDAEVIDLDSASGTCLNGQRVKRSKLMLGDQIGIGPWLFVVTSANAARETLLPARLSNALAAPRLELLIDFSKSINRAETRHLIESSIVTAAVRGSGFQRAALIYSSNNSPRMLHGYPQSLALEDISSAVLEASRRLRCGGSRLAGERARCRWRFQQQIAWRCPDD